MSLLFCFVRWNAGDGFPVPKPAVYGFAATDAKGEAGTAGASRAPPPTSLFLARWGKGFPSRNLPFTDSPRQMQRGKPVPYNMEHTQKTA